LFPEPAALSQGTAAPEACPDAGSLGCAVYLAVLMETAACSEERTRERLRRRLPERIHELAADARRMIRGGAGADSEIALVLSEYAGG
jgi:hypothetical protein